MAATLSAADRQTILSRGYTAEHLDGWLNQSDPGDAGRALSAFPVQGGAGAGAGAGSGTGTTGSVGSGGAAGAGGGTGGAYGAGGMGADILGGLEAASAQRAASTSASGSMGGGAGGAGGGAGGLQNQLSTMALRPLGNRILPQETYALAALKNRAY